MRLFALSLSIWLVACGGSSTSDPDAGPEDGGRGDACTPERCPPDPCESTTCPDPRHRCVVAEGEASCRCPAGTTAEGDRCVDEASCSETTCGPEGECSMDAGEVRCACPESYAGARCEGCASGFFRNHLDRCVADLCRPSPCDDPERSRCVIEGERARCACSVGTHEEAGRCVPDLECMPESCSGLGTCIETGDGIACECATGHAGRFCELCDEAAGYHDDGEGGCTDEVCRPNPCAAPFSRCVEGAEATCECPLGFHRVGETCALDEVCAEGSCNGHGACRVEGGVVVCACDEGWAGATCAACAPGYHDDGAGECTDDPCRPNPCASPRGACAPVGEAASCACDPGLHEDGVGGCTADPCLPHPCGEQACRVMAGAAECYTPVCDDGNPCT
ncbi:MAG: hypothetical protein KF901_28910, partial [Myxococcales bacterium]|nr:hypothetical protein [Myxococcales bacterium]